jgi:nitroimidazol reductase NimA-like FMN-containing flavoprotein (pyridoxamine 5'-phosphate oxidase superfamily)
MSSSREILFLKSILLDKNRNQCHRELRSSLAKIQRPSISKGRRSQYIPMSTGEAWSFVRNHYTMTLSTLDSFGFPHSTPVWYVVIDERIYFRAQPYKKKIQNLIKRPQVCGVVSDGEHYSDLRGVMIRGLARIVDSDRTKRKLVFAMLAEKYAILRDTKKMPRTWQERYGKEHRVVVEINPTNLVSWDNRKWLQPQSGN